MAIADLPPSFHALPMTEAERSAVMMFIADAPRVAPEVLVVAPRRSAAGRLNIVLEYPDGDTWAMSGELVGLALRIKDETGVYLQLD